MSAETTLAEVRKAPDLQVRLRRIELDDVKVLELRDWIPSLEEYGRGYWFPADRASLNLIAQAILQEAARAD